MIISHFFSVRLRCFAKQFRKTDSALQIELFFNQKLQKLFHRWSWAILNRPKAKKKNYFTTEAKLYQTGLKLLIVKELQLETCFLNLLVAIITFPFKLKTEKLGQIYFSECTFYLFV